MLSEVPNDPRCILLTGVTGFLGKVVLNELVERHPGASIFVLVRPDDRHSARDRFVAKVTRSPAFAAHRRGWDEGIQVLSGDLARPRCGLSDEDYDRVTSSVTEIIHCAASIDFDLPIAAACEANATGALEVLELARATESLRAMVSVSTAYVTPHRDGGIAEEVPDLVGDPERIYASIRGGEANEKELLARTGHPNTYTFTKCLAEQLLARRRGNVPLRIVRPSIISACVARPSAGWIDSRAALAGFVAMVGAGYMRAVVANPETRLDVVPCDEVAARIVDEAYRDGSDDRLRIVHAVAGRERGIPIRAMASIIVDHFTAHPSVRPPRQAYLGPRNVAYAFARWLYHRLPARLAALWCAFRGDDRGRARWLRGIEKLDRVNDLFAYFTQRSFDFRTSSPLDDAFSPERYFQTICEGISRHLLPPPAPARALPSGKPATTELRVGADNA
jgi:thioester reductase-like protein